jgi:hypothetical protein
MSQYRFVCHKSHTGIEPEPPQWQTSD